MAEVGDEHELSWIRKSQDGDLGAFEEIVRRYQHMIHELTYRMTGSMNYAEDLAQEIFIRAHRQIGTFRGDAKLSSWLYRIGVNTCLNWKKHERRQEQLHREWAEQDPVAIGTDETTARVQDALMKLSLKQRAAIILTIYEGMSHAEAARVLGCSETTVSWRIHVARKRLKQWLEVD